MFDTKGRGKGHEIDAMARLLFVTSSALLLQAAMAFVPTSKLAPMPQRTATRSSRTGLRMAATPAEYKACYEELLTFADKNNCAPILVRLAWHDAGTFNVANAGQPFPARGGANGSIRFEPEIKHGANAGLSDALKLLGPVKKRHPTVGWADLMQAASAAGIEATGGPRIPMKYGRKDAEGPEDCPKEGNLPGANLPGQQTGPFDDGTPTPAAHLRKVFHRMGLTDQDIVALSGAHTLGRAYKERSGLGKESTKYTDGKHIARGDGKEGHGRKGGQPWTEKFLKFDNSYFTTMYDEKADPELLKLDTDLCIFGDEGFRPFALKYKDDQAAFFADYCVSHAKLSELGAEWEVPGGVTF
ncbi:hypothetical protein VYU27_002339 [Nannochloropsis oceanica]